MLAISTPAIWLDELQSNRRLLGGILPPSSVRSTLNKAIGWTIIGLGLFCGPVPAQGTTRVEVPIFEGGAGLDFFFFAAREYEKARPEVQVDLYGDPRIADKVRVRILEGTFPEVSNAGLNYWALIRNGEILPLDAYLDGPSWDGDRTWRTSFLPGSLDRYEYEGKIYGMVLCPLSPLFLLVS